MQRSIFHVRFRNFLVQAERLTDPRLRTRPIAIISSNQQTGTIVSLSEEARQEGLERGMKVSLVRKMNHSVLLMAFNSRLYSSMNQYLYEIISSYSPLVEPAYHGQYYLDMTGMHNIYRTNKEAGNLILRGIQNKIQLTSALGISANKLISSISTLAVPEPIYEVDTGLESQFIAPLYSQILPVVKENFVKRIVEFVLLKRVRDIQQILSHSETAAVLFGKFHRQLDLQAHGRDFSPVVQMLAEQIGFELRSRKQIARSVCVEVHYSDGFRNSSKGSLKRNDDKSVTALCLNLFTKANYRRNRIRSVLVDSTDLQPFAQQLDLFDDRPLAHDALSKTVDKIRTRFGASSIHSAAALA
jgi:DNA polymerase-4